MLFPSHATAARCVTFLCHHIQVSDHAAARIVDFVPDPRTKRKDDSQRVSPSFSAVLYPQEHFSIAKQFWQHTGEGISSRRAEFCHTLFREGFLVDAESASDLERSCKGPRRYRKVSTAEKTNEHDNVTTQNVAAWETLDHDRYLEERFGRNLEMTFATRAKSQIKSRIAGCLARVNQAKSCTTSTNGDTADSSITVSESDIYLYPCGMNAIYTTHRTLLAANGDLKSISYG